MRTPAPATPPQSVRLMLWFKTSRPRRTSDGPAPMNTPTGETCGLRPTINLNALKNTLVLRSPLINAPATSTLAGAYPPSSSSPIGLLAHQDSLAPPMKELRRLISVVALPKSLRVGTYAPAQG